ncbi:MAG: TonB-dependent receptor [Duganella sp.]
MPADGKRGGILKGKTKPLHAAFAPARRALALSALAMALAGARQASAQEGAAPAAGAGELPTVVVTAEKKVNSEQKTPIAMSVYGREELESAGIGDLRSLSAWAPNVQLGGGSRPVLTMRGISSRDTTEIGDPSVVVATDDTYNNRTYALNASMYDIGRVEILRGPQGTLYGRNANGGLIHIITNKPTDKLEGDASIDVGNYNALRLHAVMNIPLGETVQMRMAATTRYHRGYLDNGPSSGDDEDTRSARAMLAFQPRRDLQGLLTVQQTSRGGVGPGYRNLPYIYNADETVSHAKPQFPGDPRVFGVPTPQYLKLNDKLVRWNFRYDLPSVQISYIGGYDSMDYHVAADSSPGPDKPVSFTQNEYPKTQNHELRIAAGDGARWAWQAGLYHFRERSSLYSYESKPFSHGRYLPTFAFEYDVDSFSTALFGQASYKLSDTLTVTGGARQTRDEKARDGSFHFATNATEPLAYLYVPQHSTGRWSKATWHAGIEWSPSKQTLVYGKYDTGYKAGGFTDISPYGPESVSGFEVGSKLRFLNNRAQLNVSAFSYDYRGQQVSETVRLDNGQTGTNIVNAGRTRIYGLEGDLHARIKRLGKVNLSVVYLHARFADFLIADSTGRNVQLAGNRPPQSPTLSLVLGLEREWNMGGGDLVGNFSMKYQGAQHFTFFNYANDLQKAYASADVSASYAPNDRKWRVQFYVRNLADTLAFTQAEESGFANSYRYAFVTPRTWGVKMAYYW